MWYVHFSGFIDWLSSYTITVTLMGHSLYQPVPVRKKYIYIDMART